MRVRKEQVTRQDYCQYLLESQINYTLTNSAEHPEKFSHDMANRYLARDFLRPRGFGKTLERQLSQRHLSF